MVTGFDNEKSRAGEGCCHESPCFRRIQELAFIDHEVIARKKLTRVDLLLGFEYEFRTCRTSSCLSESVLAAGSIMRHKWAAKSISTGEESISRMWVSE